MQKTQRFLRRARVEASTLSHEFLGRAESWLQDFQPSFRTGLLIAFVFGFAVRMIPELLSYPYPVGYDTVYYAWRIREGVIWAHWSKVFDSWLLYGLLMPLHEALKVDPILILKLAMPLLFGLNACGVHYLASKGLNWPVRKGLFAAGLFSFQLAALRMSSDLYRNMLGLGILLFTLPWILKPKVDSKSLALFSLLSIFVVFSHEFSSVLLLASVFGVVVAGGLNRRGTEALKVLGAALPAITIFSLSVFLTINPLFRVASPNILLAYQASGRYSGPLFFLTDYLAFSTTSPSYVSYISLFASVISLFAVLYAAILPLAIAGFFKDHVFNVWTGLLCVGAFSCLVLPFFSFAYWDRWMIMLVFPVAFYATNGFVKVIQSTKPVAVTLWRFGSLRISKRTARGLVLISVTSGFAFITSPMFLGKGGIYSLPTTVAYLPSTMLANTIPVCDTLGTTEALKWMDAVMDENSCLLAHPAFLDWTKLSFNGPHTIVVFKDDVYRAVDFAAAHGFGRYWLVWWNTDIGWYGFKVPETFTPVYSVDRISVFEYMGELE